MVCLSLLHDFIFVYAYANKKKKGFASLTKKSCKTRQEKRNLRDLLGRQYEA